MSTEKSNLDTLNPDLLHLLRSLTRLIYVVTEEEDRFITQFHEGMKKHEQRTWVYNAVLGLQPIAQLTREWKARTHTVDSKTTGIHDALTQIYQDDPQAGEAFYLITDPERWFKDDHAVRRIMNILHQLRNDVNIVKVLIFVGHSRNIPAKLSRFIEVVDDRTLSPEALAKEVTRNCTYLKIKEPEDSNQLFKGFTSYEIEQAITQSVVKTRKDPVNPRRIDTNFVQEYKRKQLLKTDLIQWVDLSNFSLDRVGGLGRFKEWARQMSGNWTKEGQAFGLCPPRGVLLMGVYGCGKSLSTKALARMWGLPLVQLEIGKLMSSGVGDSENNLYRALRLIEGVSPCVVWVDEAEKSLSGSQSSSRSDAGTTSRVLGILSTWVQETPHPVTLAMTANTLKTLPVEMVNRMDERFFFNVPAEEERLDILKIHLALRKRDSSNYNMARLAEVSSGLVGRELEQAVKQALSKSFYAKRHDLDEDILADELRRKPRIIKTMRDEILEILEWVGYDKELDDGVKARFASDQRGDTVKLLEGLGE